MRRSSEIIGLLALAVLMHSSLLPAEEPPNLKSMIESVSSVESFIRTGQQIPMAAIDAGPRTVPELRALLESPNEFRVHLTAQALAYLGGEEAVAALCDRDSVGRLQLTANRSPGSVDSVAAEEAIRWIRQGALVVDAKDLDPAIAVVLRHGIPSTPESQPFFDPVRHRVWVLHGTRWESRSGDGSDVDLPNMSFEVHTSADGQRALVSVGVAFGPLQGNGYDFVLRRVGATWQVQAVLFTWVS